MPEAVISTRPHDGEWAPLGRGRNAPGNTPDGVSLSSTTAGPESLTFTIRRPGDVRWDDLQPLVDVRAEVPGAGIVWSGRVHEVVPADNGQLNVACRGWQYALDDDLWRRSWVRDRTAGFQDIRTVPASINYAVFDPTDDLIATVDGAIRLQLPARALLAGQTAAVILDLGDAVGRSVAIDYVNLTGANASVNLIIQGYDDQAATTGGDTAYNTATTGLAASPFAVDMAADKRFILIGLQVATGVTPGAVVGIKITRVRVYAETAYRSGAASALLASTVVGEVRAALPWLSSDTSRIETTVTTIPHLDTEGAYETHRQTLQRVNAYHDYLFGVDELRRLFFTQRPSTPIIAIGERSGDAAFQDAGDNIEDLFNQVIVNGRDATGAQVQTLVTATSGPLARASTDRTRVLEVGASITSTDATTIGTQWLTRRSTKPTRGSVQLRGMGAAWWAETGVPIQPAACLRLCGQLIRVGNRMNPDTGGVGREAVIQAVSYDPATDTATLSLDGSRDHLDSLLARVGMYQAARPAL